MNIFIVGIGLIGGSMALDIQKQYSDAVIYGIDIKEDHLNEALEIGVIHHKATFSDLEKADIVIVSIPVDVQLEVIPEILDAIDDNTLVMDVVLQKHKYVRQLKTIQSVEIF